VAASILYDLGFSHGPLDVSLRDSDKIHGPMAQVGDAARWDSSVRQLVRPVPVDSEVQLSWNWIHREGYLVSFRGTCGALKSESVFGQGDDFNEPCSWWPR
jgi:hypothetical protein